MTTYIEVKIKKNPTKEQTIKIIYRGNQMKSIALFYRAFNSNRNKELLQIRDCTILL